MAPASCTAGANKKPPNPAKASVAGWFDHQIEMTQAEYTLFCTMTTAKRLGVTYE